MKRFLLCSCLLLTLFSCAKPTISVESVTINMSSAEIVEGETLNLTAEVHPSNADYDSIQWTSSNPSIANVDNGKVTALNEGSTSISASAGGKSASCALTVIKAVVPVESISLNIVSKELVEGDKFTLTANITPSDATVSSINWSSSDTSVATVSNGVVTAVSQGTAEISAETGGKTATCSLTVTKKLINVESISLTYNKKRLKVSETYQLSVVVTPSEANNYVLTYSSDDSSIADVDENGIVTGVAKGSTTIRIEAEGKTTSCIINVFEKDLIYAAITSYDYNDYVSEIWKDGEIDWSRKDFYIEDFNYSTSASNRIYGNHNETYRLRALVIQDGNETYLNDVGDDTRCYISSVALTQDGAYLLVGYRIADGTDKFGIWKDNQKIFDYSEDALTTEYSSMSVGAIYFDGTDVYSTGSIREPIDASKSAHYPTIWKNDKVYKKFTQIEDLKENYGGFTSVVRVNGECYMSMVEGNSGDYTSSIWNESGRLYYPGGTNTANDCELYLFDGELYSAIKTYYEDDGTVEVSLCKGEDILFTIGDAERAKFTYIDGDFYSIVVKRVKMGGNHYYSAHVYRNDTEEYELASAVLYPYFARAIHVYTE